MQALAGTGTARIARVRLHTGASDTLSQRLRTTCLIERASLGNGGLPAQAVLLLRQLQAPLPSALWRQGGAALAEWQGRLRAKVDQAGRLAVRVIQGAVPADASAVWFADQAELLVCLARDGLAGRCGALWWWRVLYGTQGPSWSVGSAWIAAPRFVPQAFHQLAQTGHAARFVSTLAPAEVEAMTHILCSCHGLTLPSPGAAVADTPGSAVRLPASLLGPASDGAMVIEGTREPGGADVRSATALKALLAATWGLDAPRATLLAVALALSDWPRQVRQAHFVRSLAAALAARGHAAQASTEKFAATAGHHESRQPLAGQALPRGLSPMPIPRTQSPLPAVIAGAAPSVRGVWAGSAAAQGGPRRQERDEPATLASPPSGAAMACEDIARAWPPRACAPLEWHEPQSLLTTAHGGVFFLVNLALSLGLYGDFTQPRGDNLALPLWDLLALCADRWLGDEERDLPLHGLLAQLAGRDATEPPATGFEPPADWRLPVPWLRPWAAQRGGWRWHENGGRLQLRHPAGFLVLDVERRAVAVRRQLAAEVAPYRATQRLRLWPQPSGQASPQAGGALDRWCQALLPFLAHRLARAVGLQDSAAAVRQVCAVPARIALSPARLDVHMRLADLPITVRCAGLDRDPGWIPAAGHDLRFHFSTDDDGPVV